MSHMTETEFETAFDAGDLDDEYSEYIMAHSAGGDRLICNGDTLLQAVDDLYLFDGFKDHMVDA